MGAEELVSPEPAETPSSAGEAPHAGPGLAKEMWDAVTEGAFDNLHFDSFFVILFVSMVLLSRARTPCRFSLRVFKPAQSTTDFGSHTRADVVAQLLFFFCFILPWTIDKIENMSKFELTPEMQEELKELMNKVRWSLRCVNNAGIELTIVHVWRCHRRRAESIRRNLQS